MALITKQDWKLNEKVMPADMIRVEGNIAELEKMIGNNAADVGKKLEALKTEILASVAKDVSGLNSKIAANKTLITNEVKRLDGKISEVHTNLTGAISGAKTELQANIDGVNKTLGARITATETKNTAQDGEIAKLKSADTEIGGRVAALETDKTAKDKDIAALKAKDVQLEALAKSEAGKVQTDLTAYKKSNNSEVSKLKAKDGTQDTQIAAAKKVADEAKQLGIDLSNGVDFAINPPSGGTLDNVVTPAVYYAKDSTTSAKIINRPPVGNMPFIVVVRGNTSYGVSQIAYELTTKGRVFSRFRANGDWGDWDYFVGSAEFGAQLYKKADKTELNKKSDKTYVDNNFVKVDVGTTVLDADNMKQTGMWTTPHSFKNAPETYGFLYVFRAKHGSEELVAQKFLSSQNDLWYRVFWNSGQSKLGWLPWRKASAARYGGSAARYETGRFDGSLEFNWEVPAYFPTSFYLTDIVGQEIFRGTSDGLRYIGKEDSFVTVNVTSSFRKTNGNKDILVNLERIRAGKTKVITSQYRNGETSPDSVYIPIQISQAMEVKPDDIIKVTLKGAAGKLLTVLAMNISITVAA